MPLLELSKVTRTLQGLLEANVERLGGQPVTVTGAPPEKVGAVSNTLSLHLYHVAQEPYYTNTPGPGRDVPNVSRNPLALCLYYILTAHHESSETDLDPFTQQNLMGLAIKTLHDFPVITDSTVVNGGSPLLAAQGLEGRDNTIQIIMRPISPEDAVSFWSTEEQQTARLAAYYEVRVILLEPEPPRTMPGIVYALGTFVVNIGSPYLDHSRSIVSFELPPSTGIDTLQHVETEPARVSTDTGGGAFPHHRLEFVGTNLLVGQSRTLVLKNAAWADQGFDTVPIDLGLNPGWAIDYRSDRIQVDVGQTASPDGSTTLDVLPGPYQASLRVVKDEEVVLNQVKQITDASNSTGFFVSPRVASHGPPDADTRITVDVEATFDLTDPALDAQVIVEGRVYEHGFDPAPGSPSDNDGHFELNIHSVTIQPLFDVTASGERLFRLVVNGAESQPFWIVTP